MLEQMYLITVPKISVLGPNCWETTTEFSRDKSRNWTRTQRHLEEEQMSYAERHVRWMIEHTCDDQGNPWPEECQRVNRHENDSPQQSQVGNETVASPVTWSYTAHRILLAFPFHITTHLTLPSHLLSRLASGGSLVPKTTGEHIVRL